MMEKRGGPGLIVLIAVLAAISAIALSATCSTALTITPAQIFIPSERVANDNRIVAETYIGLEKGETQKTISFKIPSEYSSHIIMTPKTAVISIEERVEILLKDMSKLKPGEHNIEIQVLENKKPLQNSLNDRIFIKVVVPTESNPSASGSDEDNSRKGDMIFISVTVIAIAAIVGITLILLKLAGEIKKKKAERAKRKEEEDIAFLASEIERINRKISEKGNQ